MIVWPLLSLSKAHFLLAEFGFFGLRMKTLTQTPFRCGPFKIWLCLATFDFCLRFFVLRFPRKIWFKVGNVLTIVFTGVCRDNEGFIGDRVWYVSFLMIPLLVKISVRESIKDNVHKKVIELCGTLVLYAQYLTCKKYFFHCRKD